MWKWMGLFLGKNHLLRCWDFLFLVNWIGALTLSLLLNLFALYLYKSTTGSCMEYCCHVWAGAPSCYLDILDKLQKRICKNVGFSLAASLEPLPQRRTVFSIGITLVDIHLNWLNLFYFFILEGGLLVILIDCIIFMSPFLDVTRMSMSTVSFPRTARLWNSLLIECFPLTYDLSGLKSRINRNLFPVLCS